MRLPAYKKLVIEEVKISSFFLKLIIVWNTNDFDKYYKDYQRLSITTE